MVINAIEDKEHKGMANFAPERKGYSIVLIGTFNPLMFQPEWFGKNHVIATEEVEYARNQSNSLPTLITPQLTLFRTSQLSVKIEIDRFQVVADKEPLITIKDFVKKTFEKLGGLTITAYGYNYSAHYKFGSESEIHAFADKLTPKKYWHALLGNDVEGDDRRGGLSSLQMHKSKENGEGQISLILQRSAYVPSGIFLACNDHVILKEDDSSAYIVMELIENTFEMAFNNMAKIQDELIVETTKNE
jgi:hypothetical protein